ncbi:hypothetical protein NQ317_017867 [Molorchus minor]|uniref:Uncharacterized protein n=1 Tax=Molorchus minor TaxID=1323400 RepID=A0ABQ9JA95_9CUCU|nr:hypothetical protein NQ317_017867 [Molorchus minor]
MPKTTSSSPHRKKFERHISTARGRYKCTESIYVLHIPVLYTEHFVKLVRKAYIDRFERHISTAGRCVAAGHAVGSEAATGAAKPPRGVGAADPASLAELGN